MHSGGRDACSAQWPTAFHDLTGRNTADPNQVLGQTFRLFSGPFDLTIMQSSRVGRHVGRERSGDGLRNTSRRFGIGGCLMAIVEHHAIMLGDVAESALPPAVPVEGLVDHERVDNRRGLVQGGMPVARRLVMKQSEIERRVISHDGEPSFEQRTQGCEDLTDTRCRRRTFCPGTLRGHAVHLGSGIRNVDPGVKQPMSTFDAATSGVKNTHIGRHDSIMPRVYSGRL